MEEDSAVWSDDFSLGVPFIDDQHKKLVVMIGDLFRSCREGSGAANVTFSLAFTKASNYSLTHFMEEEELLEKAGYPALAAHKKEHESFLAEIQTEFHKFKENNAAPIGLARFLKKWLMNHIAINDKQYVPYVKKMQAL